MGSAFHKIAEELTKIHPKEDKKAEINPVIQDVKKKRQDFQLKSGAEKK